MPEQNNNVDKAVKKMGLRLTIVVLFLIFCFIIYQKNGEQIKNTLVSAYNKTILFLLGKRLNYRKQSPFSLIRISILKKLTEMQLHQIRENYIGKVMKIMKLFTTIPDCVYLKQRM